MAEGQGNYIVTFVAPEIVGVITLVFALIRKIFTMHGFSPNMHQQQINGEHGYSEIRMAPYSGAHLYSNPAITNIGDVEVGTTSSNTTILVANYGDADLVITDIPSSVGDFDFRNDFIISRNSSIIRLT